MFCDVTREARVVRSLRPHSRPQKESRRSTLARAPDEQVYPSARCRPGLQRGAARAHAGPGWRVTTVDTSDDVTYGPRKDRSGRCQDARQAGRTARQPSPRRSCGNNTELPRFGRSLRTSRTRGPSRLLPIQRAIDSDTADTTGHRLCWYRRVSGWSEARCRLGDLESAASRSWDLPDQSESHRIGRCQNSLPSSFAASSMRFLDVGSSSDEPMMLSYAAL
jgi:hypothetical protein